MLIKNSAEETTHLRTKSRFYVAGWVANTLNELPQKLPKGYTHNPAAMNLWTEYLLGYGDSYANNESV